MTEQFFIVGAQRSGTTYLYRMLEQHPDVCMARPIRPEPKFFLRDDLYAKGLDAYERTFYAHHTTESHRGEKSTSYIESDKAIDRIAAHFPNAKIIFMLRDPVQRAISNYQFSRYNGLEPLSFRDALDAEPHRLEHFDRQAISVSPYAYQTRGHYIRYIERWAERYPQHQLILLTSEFLLGSETAVRVLFERLDLRTDVPLHRVGEPVNSTDPNGEGAPDQLADELTIRRLRQHFHPSNIELADRFNVDISPWRA